MALFEYLYTITLIVFCVPIVLGFILRKIAGKHAPAYYEPETPQEEAARKLRVRRQEDRYWSDLNNDLI